MLDESSKNKIIHHYTYEDKLLNKPVDSIVVDSKGVIYAGQGDYVSVLEPGHEKFSQVKNGSNIKNLGENLAIDKEDNVYAGNKGKNGEGVYIYKFNPDNFNFDQISKIWGEDGQSGPFFDEHGYYYVIYAGYHQHFGGLVSSNPAFSSGLVFRGGDLSLFDAANYLQQQTSANNAEDFYLVKIASKTVCHATKGDSNVSCKDFDSLPANINNINFDVTQKLYVGTDNGLAVQNTPNQDDFTVYTTDDGLASNKIRRIYFDDKEIAYIITDLGLSISKNQL